MRKFFAHFKPKDYHTSVHKQDCLVVCETNLTPLIHPNDQHINLLKLKLNDQ